MMYLGRIYMLQNKYDLAIQTLVNSVKADPASARSYRLLGEAYIMDRKGSLGVDALNEAIRLDPIAMADGHLLMARLYDLAGAKAHASREYRLFLQKVPQHPDAKKFQKYIQEHPDTTN
jgi:cytochrome c-type biogenesis protein CcmH/NrfG